MMNNVTDCCLVATLLAAMWHLVDINEDTGRCCVPAYLGWAQLMATVSTIVALRWALKGGGEKQEATIWQCLSHGCCIWEAMCFK